MMGLPYRVDILQDGETVSGMLSGLKLTGYADNAAFYGLSGGKSHYDSLFNTGTGLKYNHLFPPGELPRVDHNNPQW